MDITEVEQTKEMANEYLNVDEIKKILENIEAVFKSPNDKFFEDGNKFEKKFIKQGVLSLDDEEDHHIRKTVTCNVPGCTQYFETVFAYESHYNALHRYLCSQCKKNLPSSHLLDLHISEQHDSFFAAQAERKPMFSCYIQECQHKSTNQEERKDHCIRLHKFPPNFRFDKSTSGSTKKNLHKISAIDKMDVAYDGESSSKMTNFSFGHQKKKVFNNTSYAKVLTKNNTKKIETKCVLDDKKMIDDLMESLP